MTSRSNARKKEEFMPLKEQNGTSSSASASQNRLLKPYPKLSDLPPIGQSLWPILWDRDPTPSAWKAIYCISTVFGLTCLIFLSDIMMTIFPSLDASWDENHGITSSSSLTELIQATTGLSDGWIQVILWITLGAFLTFIGADIVLGLISSSKKQESDTYPWPNSWKTDNYLCYHDMFAEPTRHGWLIRRPGNTLSNVNYLVSSLVVFGSSILSDKSNIFWVSDAEFSFMLLMLTIFSTIWHGSNAPWSQYPDLWAMDSCIFYLMIRYACLGGIYFLHQYFGVTLETCQFLGATSCSLIYTGVIVSVAKFYYGHFQNGWLHSTCPYSARARMMGVSDIFGHGHLDIYIGSTVCAFAALPIYYMSIPTLINQTVIGSFGSITAAHWVLRSLVVGWTYRMWDRWVLDGNPLMNYWVEMKPSVLRTVGAALFSGTAQMHFWTGITLMAGYMHGRSVEGKDW